jgi:hypothetical protein
MTSYNEKDVAAAIAEHKKGPPSTDGLTLSTIDICAGQPIPPGWIVVQDFWDPTRCGFPSVVTLNMQRIVEYANLPVGTVMNVCAYAPVPHGWVDLGTFWNPSCCGYPAIVNLNVRKIQRAS